MRVCRAILCLLLLSFLGAVPVRAITTVARGFDQLVARAETVFKGIVTAKVSQWTGEGQTRHIATFVTFRVAETYKGASASEQTLRFVGGTLDGITTEIPDMPRFEVGQTAVLFVVGNGKQFCPLVGIAQGRFHVVRDEATGYERIFADDGSPVVHTSDLGQVDAAGAPLSKNYAGTGARAMAVDDFRTEILNKVSAPAR